MSLRIRLTAAVLAALVLPSLVAWSLRGLTDGGDRARTAAVRDSPAAPSATPTGSPTGTPTGSPSATPTGSPSQQVAGPAAPAREASRLPSAVRPEVPTGVRLPSGVRVRVVPARTRGDGSLAVPDDLRVGGWWRGGARLGDPFGSMLVAAHVDAIDRGLGPFVALLSVRRGATFTVTSRSLTQRYRVTTRRIIDRDRLPRARWVSSYAGPHRLTLVTCAPPYVRARGGYQNLAVVVAYPVGGPTRR